MNLPNQLTVSRFLLTIAFLVAIFIEFPLHETAALALFVAAGITDWMDGAIARSRNLITNFGKLMDPLADKILVCSAFIAFVSHHWIAGWIAVVIVARELAITGLRLLAASKNVVLAAEGWGKHKTIWQMITIIAVLVKVSYGQWGPIGHWIFGFPVPDWSSLGHLASGQPMLTRPWVIPFTELSTWLTVLLTFISGWLYLWRNRQLYLTDM